MSATVLRRPLSAVLIVLLVFTMLPLVSTPPAAHAALPPASSDYNSVVFVDDTWGWVAGTNGTILRTRNGGDNWEVLNTETTADFVSVSFVDRDHGWALTSSARVYRTQDGGDSWTLMSAYRFRGIELVLGIYNPVGYELHFIDQNTGYLVARAYPEGGGQTDILGLVFRTTDAGQSWSLALEGPDHRIAGDTYPFPGRSVLRAVDFASATHGWVVGVDQYVGRKPVVYRTTTGGGTGSWTEAGTGISGSADLHGVSFATQSAGLAVGERLRWDTSSSPARWVSDGGAVYRSTNGGVNWTAQTSGTTSRLNDVFMLDTQRAWAVGENGTVRRTQDGGVTWSAGWAQSVSGVSLRSVHMTGAPGLKGWLAGSGGRVRITTNGQDWYPPNPDLSGPTVTGVSSATHPDPGTWYNNTSATPTFTWAASSDPWGIEGYSVSWSNDSQFVPNDIPDVSGTSARSWSPAAPMTDGVWYFKVKAKNGLGNWGPPATYSVRYDTVKPSGSVSINQGAEYTASLDVTLNSDIDFGASGPGEMRLRFDGAAWGGWESFQTDRQIALPAGGDVLRTVYVEFKDAAGNVSAPISDSITVDTALPSVTSLTSSSHSDSNKWYPEKAVALAWTAEAGSGIVGYSYSWSQDPGVEPDEVQDTAVTSHTVNNVADGIWYFKVRAENSLGVWGPPVSRAVRVDGTTPTGSVSINEDAQYTNSRDVMLVTSVTAWGPSGADEMLVSTDGGATWGDPEPFVSPKSVSLPLPSGEKTVAVRVRDQAGNESDQMEDSIMLDEEVPSASVVLNGGNSDTRVREISVQSDVVWGPSGAASMQFSFDGGLNWGDELTFAPSTTIELPESDGTKGVRVRFISNAGNVSQPFGTNITLDTTAPTVTTLSINGGASYTNSTSVQVSSLVSWGASGADQMRFRINGGAWGSWRPYATPAAVTLPSGAGVKTVTVEFRDKAGNLSATRHATIELLSSRETPIAGSNRYDTAVKTSAQAYPNGLSTSGKRTVLIATGQNWPDALGGSALAGAVDGPILLVEPGSVPAAVSREITRLGARRAIILGGTAAVGPNVEKALRSQLAGNVERLAGSNRYLTADRIALRVISELGASYDGRAFVATGGNFPDALAAAPLAAANGWPLFLSDPGTGQLPASSLNAMRPRVKNVVILGGTAVVSPGVETTLRNTFNNKVTRLAGTGRYDTASRVAAYGVANSDLSWARVGISTGTNFPDALAGGVLMGKVGGVVLLTESHRLSGETSSALTANRSRVMNVIYFGGTSAVSNTVRAQVRSVLRW